MKNLKKRFENLSEEEIRAKVEKTWKALNKLGIYTEEQLNEAIKKQPPLNIGCMVSPVKKVGTPMK